MLRTS